MNQPARKIPFYPVAILLKMAFQNGGVSVSRFPIFLIYILRYIILEPFRLIQVFMFQKRIENHELTEQPIFVLGHWRSGTSHLQNLLFQDPGMTTSTIFSGLFADNYLVSGFWLSGFLNFICRIFKVKYSIQRTPMNLNIPVELDSSLCAMTSENCYTWGQLFPKRFEKWLNKIVFFQDEKTTKEWIRDYDFMIRKLSYKSKGKRVIVKTPGDTARIALLLKKYPKAKFIYIHREPIPVFHSNLYLWKVIQTENSVQKISKDEIKRLIIKTYKQLLTAYLEQRKLLPASQLIEVHFKNIQQNPLREIKAIYSKLGLSAVPEKELTSLISVNKSYKVNSYSTPTELENELKIAWDFAFKEWPAQMD
jgi:hypothetical protein